MCSDLALAFRPCLASQTAAAWSQWSGGEVGAAPTACLPFADSHRLFDDGYPDQLKREPYPFPILRIETECRDIDKISYADLKLEGYKSHKRIKMKMAV